VLAAVQNASYCAVLADIEAETLTLNASDVQKDCAAIIAPHAYGAPVHASAIQCLGLPWIEDCATSPATIVEGRPAGASGTLAIFSFASTKYFTGGSGGMVVCDDDVLAARIQDLLEFDSFEKGGQWGNGWLGALPGRMADLNASIAKVQLDRMAEFFKRRREIAEIYNAQLPDVPGLKLMKLTSEHSFYRYIVRTDRTSESIRESLSRDGIDARTSVNPWLDRIPSSQGRVEGGPWPDAAAWRGHLLSLPIHPSMSDEDAILVAESLRRASESC
jgi:dTDP-4-amino-4,6-dideoxygalactose transaminase